MNILVTGAKGFVGRNLCENLKNIRDGKNRTRPALNITDIFEYDLDTAPALLDEYCAKAAAQIKRLCDAPPRQTLYSTWPGSTAPKWKASSWRAISDLPPPCWIR